MPARLLFALTAAAAAFAFAFAVARCWDEDDPPRDGESRRGPLASGLVCGAGVFAYVYLALWE